MKKSGGAAAQSAIENESPAAQRRVAIWLSAMPTRCGSAPEINARVERAMLQHKPATPAIGGFVIARRGAERAEELVAR